MRFNTFDHIEKYDRVEAKSKASLQWKGTDACIDIWCECGYASHLDTDFLHHFQCANCQRCYVMSPNIRMLPITSEEAESTREQWSNPFHSDDSDLEYFRSQQEASK